MAINFVARKCACGGTLEFNSIEKIWICKYCGTVIEREATFDKVQVDGIEGINDVVRQTLNDIAYKRMESAEKNLQDCERKNYKHIGTLIANLSFYMTKISLSKDKKQIETFLEKVKYYAKRMNEEFPVIAEDEINLYEFLGSDASDIYANLIAIFDTIKSYNRVEYIRTKINSKEIFSEESNKSLLKISIKQGEFDVVDSIVDNTNNIDKKSTFLEIISNYPDGDKKREIINKLLDTSIGKEIQNLYYENYIAKSSDSIITKNLLLLRMAEVGVKCNPEVVIDGLYKHIDNYQTAKETFNALFKSKLTDKEVGLLLTFCITENKRYEIIKAFFDTLIQNQKFMQVNSRDIISLLDSPSFSEEELVEVLKSMLQFDIDNKNKDIVYNYYLNKNEDKPEIREIILSLFLVKNCPISTSTIETYVIETFHDGINKLNNMKKIFATGFNRTFLSDLLSKYLLSEVDEINIKNQIINYLIEEGFKVDSKTLDQYIVLSKEDISNKVDIIKMLIGSGTQIGNDSLDTYLISLEETSNFSTEIFNLLNKQSYTISADSINKYILLCKDIEKTEHGTMLIRSSTFDFNVEVSMVSHLGNEVNCNLFQAYVLVSQDCYEVARVIVECFSSKKIKLNSPIYVNGQLVKFKKYVADKKNELSPLTLQICEERRMFSIF